MIFLTDTWSAIDTCIYAHNVCITIIKYKRARARVCVFVQI